MCMYVYVCVRVCVLWRSARKREACVDFGVHEQTRQNVNVLLALLIRAAAAAAAAALASQSSQLRHEPSDIVCSCIAERQSERQWASAKCKTNNKAARTLAQPVRSLTVAVFALLCSLPRSTLSIVFAFNFNGFQSFFVFCLPFFLQQSAMRMLLLSCLRSRSLAYVLRSLSSARSLELFPCGPLRPLAALCVG